MKSPREIVRQCLRFETPECIPRDLWVLPWAEKRFPEELAALRRDYPNDFVMAPPVGRPSSVAKGDPYSTGTYTDAWGCVFKNVPEGVIGEVKDPILTDISDLTPCRPPYETLPEDAAAARDEVNRFCAGSDLFVMAPCCPRPWERMQFLQGTVNACPKLPPWKKLHQLGENGCA